MMKFESVVVKSQTNRVFGPLDNPVIVAKSYVAPRIPEKIGSEFVLHLYAPGKVGVNSELSVGVIVGGIVNGYDSLLSGVLNVFEVFVDGAVWLAGVVAGHVDSADVNRGNVAKVVPADVAII